MLNEKIYELIWLILSSSNESSKTILEFLTDIPEKVYIEVSRALDRCGTVINMGKSFIEHKYPAYEWLNPERSRLKLYGYKIEANPKTGKKTLTLIINGRRKTDSGDYRDITTFFTLELSRDSNKLGEFVVWYEKSKKPQKQTKKKSKDKLTTLPRTLIIKESYFLEAKTDEIIVVEVTSSTSKEPYNVEVKITDKPTNMTIQELGNGNKKSKKRTVLYSDKL